MREEGGEPTIPALQEGEELGRKKWQLKPKVENEVEGARLDVEMDWRELYNLVRKHKMVVKAFKGCS